MLGCEAEMDPVGLRPQESLSRGHRLQDACLSLLTKVILDPAQPGHQADHALRNMRVQIVAHDVPWGRCAARREQGFEKAHMVFFGSRIADNALYLAGGDIERRDQRLRPMALVFVFRA